MAKQYLLIVTLLISICLACKKEMPVHSDLELSAISENNNVVLNWTPVLLSGFKSINVYRSTSPIPDPQIHNPIDGDLLLATISDQNITTFRDSTIVINQEGNVYYKIVVNLSDRIISSNEVEVSIDGFSIAFNSMVFQAGPVLTIFPERNIFYLFSHSPSKIHLVDYSQKKIVNTFPFPMVRALYPTVNSGSYELFAIMSGTQIACYDALTLNPKYSITIPSAKIGHCKVIDNFMYVLYYTNNLSIAKMRIYDLSTQTIVGEKMLCQSPDLGGCAIYIGKQSNSLFLKFRTQLTNNQGNYVYRNVCVKYNMINHVPTDSVIISHPLLIADSIGGSNFHYIQPSPNFEYLLCNSKGDILSLGDQSIHNVGSNNNSATNVEFSQSGSYLLAKSWNGTRGDVYALPGFNLVTSVRTPNSNIVLTSFIIHIRDVFFDNDSLVSYSFKCINEGNQANSVFTGFFKKFN